MKTFAVAALALLMGSSALAAPDAKPAPADKKDMYPAFDTFSDAVQKLHDHYVEPVTWRQIIDKAIAGAAAELDPHSSYLTPKEFADMQITTKAAWGGIGLELTMEDGLPEVIAPIDDSPSALAGIRAGDYLLAIDGTATTGVSLNGVIDMMRGAVGSTTTVTIARNGQHKPFDVTMKRAVVHLDTVKSRREGDAGVIRISALHEDTDAALRRAVKSLGDVKGYVIDLRNDPGGLLDMAVTVSDEFLDKGEIIALRGRNPGDNTRYAAKPGDLAHGKPVVVIINQGTASGAEIVAGALQDNRRATVIGETSFGNGTIQTIIPITGGGALRLTTAHMILPSGRSFQAVGIAPDVVVIQGTPDKGYNPKEAQLAGHFPATAGAAAKPKEVHAPKPGATGDYQLTYALALIDGKPAP